MQQVINAVDILPVSTASCERGFSKMNLICTSLRSSLSVSHMSSLIFLSIEDPPLLEWKPMKYVTSWISLGRHDASSVTCPARKTLVSNCEKRCLWKVMQAQNEIHLLFHIHTLNCINFTISLLYLFVKLDKTALLQIS